MGHTNKFLIILSMYGSLIIFLVLFLNLQNSSISTVKSAANFQENNPKLNLSTTKTSEQTSKEAISSELFFTSTQNFENFGQGSTRTKTCRAITTSKTDGKTLKNANDYLKNSTAVRSYDSSTYKISNSNVPTYNISNSTSKTNSNQPATAPLNCTLLKNERGYIQHALSKEEQNYPIAYSFVIHKELEVFERLFRAVYHPQNYYCVHVDDKSDADFKQKIGQFLSCFENAFEPETREKVYYAHYSRLMADVHCLDGLNKFSERKVQAGNGIPYKYVFNLCGQDFPIKTNFELVRALKELNGRDECESFDLEGAGKIGRVQKGYSLGAGGGGYNELRGDTACFYKYVRFKGHK